MNGMEVKNGIIIDGVLHESSEGFCNECSLCQECSNLLDDNYCALLDLGIGQCFVSRGKVTDNVSVEKAIEVLSSILESWVHGGDADCIIAEFEEKLMKTK